MKREKIIEMLKFASFKFEDSDGIIHSPWITLNDAISIIDKQLALQPEPPTEEIYRKVYIKDKSDLPKGDGKYIVHSKIYGWTSESEFKLFENENYPTYNQSIWMNNFDWYFQPIPEQPIKQSEPKVSDEEIKEYAKSFPGNLGSFVLDNAVTAGFIEGAKAMRDNPKQFKSKK